MKNIFKLVVIGILGLVLVSCGSSKDDTKSESKVVYVGTNAEFPPFEYLENGKLVGFDMELIQAMGKIMGKEIKIEDMSFDGLLPALQSKKVDAVIAGLTATKERRKAVNFTKSYYTASQVIIVKETSEDIKSFNQLKGKKIGVMLGFTGDVIVSAMKDVSITRYNAAYAAIMSLQSDKIDAVVLDSEPAKNFIANNKGLMLASAAAEMEEYAIAVTKSNENLLVELEKALEEVKTNGTYDELIKKYFK